METILEKLDRWCTTGKTGVPEMIEDQKAMVRKMAYDRDVQYLYEDIIQKYPSLIGRRDDIYKLLREYPPKNSK